MHVQHVVLHTNIYVHTFVELKDEMRFFLTYLVSRVALVSFIG